MIEQKVRSILRQQQGILETEKCGVLIAKLRNDEDLMVVPVFDAHQQAVGLIDRQSALAMASNPLHFSVYQNRSAKMMLQESFPSFDIDTSIDEASQKMLEMGLSLSQGGFLITEKGQYAGIGINTDMLGYLVEANLARAEALQELHTEMMDSVNYAGRIQSSLLPNRALLNSGLRSVGVLWEPRDIVGGDVYWRTEADHEGTFTLALIDCTGHGVPGSLMSMLVVSALNRIYAEKPSIGPGEALSNLGNLVRTALNQDREDCQSNDGFDAGLCKIDTQKKTITFSGARTNCFVVPKENVAIMRLLGEKQALGYPGQTPYTPLEEYELAIDKCETFFMASDGVLDQPGGDNSRAYGPKRLLQHLENHRHLGAEALMMHTKTAVDLWRGAETRRDDVSALAFSII
jgi:serine phosphatase RsbU (regulator of sigma subunit)